MLGEDEKYEFKNVSGKPKGKRAIGRHRHKWMDNIKVNLNTAVWGDLKWLRIECSSGIL
jgi:hypothetical protein